MEPYLHLVKKPRFRNSITKFRCSSHTSETERGRHTNPQTAVADMVCVHCQVIEDEKHFLLKCGIDTLEKQCFYENICLNDEENLFFVLTNVNSQYVYWLGEFLYLAVEKRNDFAMCR